MSSGLREERWRYCLSIPQSSNAAGPADVTLSNRVAFGICCADANLGPSSLQIFWQMLLGHLFTVCVILVSNLWSLSDEVVASGMYLPFKVLPATA